ncbi:LytTR family DNA-binding domain-containing protein [Paraclostridium sordellii]|uniref:LytTR family DNA-binding domain-containing protein n=1 Tax=Paraclostridium sordellii TaxID=1505 RepID=UPI0005DC8715|nr:LytTR family DNA-binding domain-containing protein [Paeniclostridium sordellii]MCH1965170.1 LytTR family transcriptional regulator [Paeniclostridium sordellii]MDU2147089.1 LytTR family DNA-binding domain-containing protein [Paeniclostridium sordellii]CEN92468.1 response regulator [[Clostridium] sordellii] [Paeniclostridium sordellii]CEN96861.1 response regulator [[Clostridium] sordellii] [Paeniclostridium sordellii]CEO21721.1 response regulator [[Clostridium] sordellii] [Paeniclostridium so
MKIDIDIDKKYKEIQVILKSPNMDEETLEILEKLKTRKTKYILGKKDKKIYILDINEVYIFYSENQKVFVETNECKYEVEERLYEIEENLKSTSFVRVSKFAVVNMKKVRNIDMHFNGNLTMNLINNKKENISRRYISKIKDYLNNGGF